MKGDEAGTYADGGAVGGEEPQEEKIGVTTREEYGSKRTTGKMNITNTSEKRREGNIR